jgi:hypothetical protein
MSAVFFLKIFHAADFFTVHPGPLAQKAIDYRSCWFLNHAHQP